MPNNTVVKKVVDNFNSEVNIDNKNVNVIIFPKSLDDLSSNLKTKAEVSVNELNFKDRSNIEAVASENKLIEKIDDKIINISIKLDNPSDTPTSSAKEVSTLNQAAKITFDLSNTSLSADDINKLTGVSYDIASNGKVTIVKLGGKYDKSSKTFTFYASKTGNFGVAKANSTTIDLTVNKTQAFVNKVPKENDISPILIDGRVMVPVRFIAESLGEKVNWDANTRTVTITNSGATFNLTIGKIINDVGVPPIIKNDRTLVPIRYISNQLGAEISWNEADKSVKLIR